MSKTVKLVPENERWVHAPEIQDDLEESFTWAAKNPPQVTELDDLEENLLREQEKRVRSS